MGLYIRRIFSPSLQGGFDHELSPKTLLFGKNASGKSRVRRGIELVLKGTASDIAGRDEVAKDIELLSLATPGKGLEVRAFLSDGSECHYLLNRKVTGKGKVSSSAVEPVRPASVDPATVLPLWTLRDGILGAPGAARRFFLAHTVREVQRSDILARLPGQLHAVYIKAVEASGIQAMQPEINKLLAALEIATAKAGTSVREANATKKAVSEAGQGLGAPPTEAEKEEARAAVASAKAALEAAVVGYQQQSQREELAARLGAAQHKQIDAANRLQQTQQHLQYIEAEVAKLPSIEAAKAAVPALSLLVKATIDAVLCHAKSEDEARVMADPVGPSPDASPCGVCGTLQPFGHFTARAAIAQAELDRHAAATKTATDNLAWVQSAHVKADEYLTGARFEVDRASSALAAAGDAIKQIASMLATVPESTPALTIENARMALSSAEERQRQLDSSNAAWESTRKMRDGAVTAEAEGNKWAQLKDACSEVVRELLDSGIATFNARVQAFLPASDKFDLRLRDGGREVCQFGLRRGEALHTALSGAEWARVTAALASVCGPNREDRLAVVCPEERAFDPVTLSEVMRSLGKIPQQVVLESPVRPSLVPEGWTVVEVEEVRRAPAAPAAPAAPEPKTEPPRAPAPPPFAR